jgi:ABC-2 type transport system permease protein
MMKYLKLFKKTFALELSSELAYKANFIIKLLALVLADMVGPLVILLIYTTTSGIPGWTFEQFILFQGTFVFVIGFSHFMLFTMPYTVIENIREGTFDTILIKPFKPLLYLTFRSIDLEGLAEVVVGLGLIIWSLIKLNLSIFSLNFLVYILLVIIGLLFMYALMILTSSLSFLVVKSYAVAEFFLRLIDLARYPINIYSYSFRFVLTFLFPIAIVSNYPAAALLQSMSLINLIKIILPVFIFLGITIFLWNLAMKKYSSAGG